jgi:hypothetical protein
LRTSRAVFEPNARVEEPETGEEAA